STVTMNTNTKYTHTLPNTHTHTHTHLAKLTHTICETCCQTQSVIHNTKHTHAWTHTHSDIHTYKHTLLILRHLNTVGCTLTHTHTPTHSLLLIGVHDGRIFSVTYASFFR